MDDGIPGDIHKSDNELGTGAPSGSKHQITDVKEARECRNVFEAIYANRSMWKTCEKGLMEIRFLYFEKGNDASNKCEPEIEITPFHIDSVFPNAVKIKISDIQQVRLASSIPSIFPDCPDISMLGFLHAFSKKPGTDTSFTPQERKDVVVLKGMGEKRRDKPSEWMTLDVSRLRDFVFSESEEDPKRLVDIIGRMFPQFNLASTDCEHRYIIIHTRDNTDHILFMRPGNVQTLVDTWFIPNGIEQEVSNSCIGTAGVYAPVITVYSSLVLTDFVKFGSSLDDILSDMSDIRSMLGTRQTYKDSKVREECDKIEQLIQLDPQLNKYMGDSTKSYEFDTMNVYDQCTARGIKLDKAFLFTYVRWANLKNRLQYHIMKEIFAQHDTIFENVQLYNIVPASRASEARSDPGDAAQSGKLLCCPTPDCNGVGSHAGMINRSCLHSERLFETCTKQLMKIGDRYIFLGECPKFGLHLPPPQQYGDLFEPEATGTATPIHYESTLADTVSLMVITALIPRKLRGFYWHLIYDSRRDGNSFLVLKTRIQVDNTVLILKVGDALVGCFTSQQWRLSHVHYGNPDTFVFRLKPTDQAGVFTWSGRDDNIQLLRADVISVGSGPCLSIDSNFNITCRKSKTFNCHGLIPASQGGADLRVTRIELWHLDPCETL